MSDETIVVDERYARVLERLAGLPEGALKPDRIGSLTAEQRKAVNDAAMRDWIGEKGWAALKAYGAYRSKPCP